MELISFSYYHYISLYFHCSLGEEYRPVKLRKIVLGYPCSDKQTDFKFDFGLNYKLSNIVQTYSENRPTLIVRRNLTYHVITFSGSFPGKRFKFDFEKCFRLIFFKYSLCY